MPKTLTKKNRFAYSVYDLKFDLKVFRATNSKLWSAGIFNQSDLISWSNQRSQHVGFPEYSISNFSSKKILEILPYNDIRIIVQEKVLD